MDMAAPYPSTRADSTDEYAYGSDSDLEDEEDTETPRRTLDDEVGCPARRLRLLGLRSCHILGHRRLDWKRTQGPEQLYSQGRIETSRRTSKVG